MNTWPVLLESPSVDVCLFFNADLGLASLTDVFVLCHIAGPISHWHERAAVVFDLLHVRHSSQSY